jgi:hypothetical protein
LAASAVAVLGRRAGGAEASVGATGAGVSPFRAADEPAGRRLRLRLAPVLERSGVAAFAGATTASTSATGAAPSAPDLVPAAAGVDLRLRRRREVEVAGTTGSLGAAAAPVVTALRMTLAPTSPSAQRAPSAVCTSTRQTTMAVVTFPTGGRFCVSVQRA